MKVASVMPTISWIPRTIVLRFMVDSRARCSAGDLLEAGAGVLDGLGAEDDARGGGEERAARGVHGEPGELPADERAEERREGEERRLHLGSW